MASVDITRKEQTAAASGIGYLDFEKPLARIEAEISTLENQPAERRRDMSSELKKLRTSLKKMTRQIYSKLTAWETVQVARHPQRPILTDYIRGLARDFVELHGDRSCGDDRAIVTGFARLAGHKVMLIGHNKGKHTKEKIACHFGCAHPEGYRKALHKMKLAEKFGLPIVCLIDTQGAYPGIGSEERGIAQAIAVNLMEMSRLHVPIVCAVIGEGGSGGALGIGVGDRVAMLAHSFYSVISPEGCAAILFKTGDEAKRAAELLHLTARELKKLDIIDDIIPEPSGGAHRHADVALQNLEGYLGQTLQELKRVRVDTLLKRRYQKWRTIASFFTGEPTAPATQPDQTHGDDVRPNRRGSTTALPGARALRRSGTTTPV